MAPITRSMTKASSSAKELPIDAIQKSSREIRKNPKFPSSTLAGVNYLVVRNLAKHMKIKDLRQSRLVNSLWDEVCKWTLKRKETLTFRSFKRLQGVIECFQLNDMSHQNYKFQKNLNMTSLHPKSMMVTNTLFETYGHQISNLKVGVRFKLPGESSRFQYLLSKLVNLTVLHLNISYRSEWSPLEFPGNIVELPKVKKLTVVLKGFKSLGRFLNQQVINNRKKNKYRSMSRILIDIFPRLEAIQLLPEVNCIDRYYYDPLIDAIIAEPSRLSNLSKLFIAVNDVTLGALANCSESDLRIKTLSLNLQGASGSSTGMLVYWWGRDESWTMDTSRNLKALLERQAPNLENIILTFNFSSPQVMDFEEEIINGLTFDNQIIAPLDFPETMPNLLSLKIYSWSVHDPTPMKFPTSPVNYPQQFPKLRKLSVFGDNGHMQMDLCQKLLEQTIPSQELEEISFNLPLRIRYVFMDGHVEITDSTRTKRNVKSLFPNAKFQFSKPKLNTTNTEWGYFRQWTSLANKEF